MSEHDDDDDGALQPLRAVWLSMRDEEPPAGGMAALMAAAREQADKMKRPSAWQRFLGALRTPPVLALAGVAVLISGALVLGNRREEMAAPTQPAAPAREVATQTSTPTVDQAVAPSDDEGQSGSAAAAAESEPARIAPPPVTRPARRQTVKPAPPLEPEPRAHDTAPETTRKSSGSPSDVGTGAPSGETITLDATPKPPPRAPAASGASLAKQTEAAAARGDCAGVKQHARELSRTDRSTYESLVRRNAAVARCLRE